MPYMSVRADRRDSGTNRQTDRQWDRQSQSEFCCAHFRHCFVAPSFSLSHLLPLSFTLLSLSVKSRLHAEYMQLQGINGANQYAHFANLFHLFHFWTWKICVLLCGQPVLRTGSPDIKWNQNSANCVAACCCTCCTQKDTHKHTPGGKKSPPKNYHNQLAHVEQVVPKATDQFVCVCVCVQHHLHTLDVYVIFSSLFHFEHSFLWQRQFDRKKREERKMYYNNYRDFCPCQASSCHVACAVQQLQLQRSKIFGHMFIYIWHAHQFMYVYSIYGRFNFKDKLEMNEEKGNFCNAFNASVARGIYR